MTLGELNGTHLGKTVAWQVGGGAGILTGVLHSVKHTWQPWASNQGRRKTAIHVKNGTWDHADVYSPFTRCTVTDGPPAPLALAMDTTEAAP